MAAYSLLAATEGHGRIRPAIVMGVAGGIERVARAFPSGLTGWDQLLASVVCTIAGASEYVFGAGRGAWPRASERYTLLVCLSGRVDVMLGEVPGPFHQR